VPTQRNDNNSGDVPMDKDSILENENKNPLKSYFTKIWDKEKSMGKIP
jgi:hypothetical protein